MMVRAVVAPTVPVGTERIRVCLHAGNTVSEVERLVEALQTWCEQVEQEGDEEQSRARL